MPCSLFRFSCRKMGARPGLHLILCQNGLILRPNSFQVIINDDFLDEESVTADHSTIHIAYTFIINLSQLPGSRLFGSVVEHWINDPAARVRIPPKSWDFFQPNLLCFVLCLGFYVVRSNIQNCES